MAREGFVLYHEILDWMEPYGDAERGRILTAMLEYSITGEAPGLTGNERFIWPAIRAKIENDRKAYETTCEKNRKNVSKRHDRTPEDTTVYDRIPKDTTVYDRIPNVPTETETKTETETETKDSPSESKKAPAHKHGKYGWVRLTEDQFQRLLEDLGPLELERCINYIDESAQQTGNKNKWKDWNLTIRKCAREGWGKPQSSRGYTGKNVAHVDRPEARTNVDTAQLDKIKSIFG